MPTVDLQIDCPIHQSVRTRAVERLFDLPSSSHRIERFTATVPGLDEPWQIGVIVGPSGSGKSTIARATFGGFLHRPKRWRHDRAVVDCFGPLPIERIVRALNSVGFSSPPSWMKPFAVLSTGEQFRCELARALVRGSEVVVVDEFTSALDRPVAKICAAAVSRAVRADWLAEATESGSRRAGVRRFVAVTCHRDIVEWLSPDWVLDMASGSLVRGRLQRPSIHLRIEPGQVADWRLFKRHHYLSASLHRSARCFIGWVDDRPAAFSAVLAFPHPRRPGWREHRTVCLPDFQGIGIGNAMSEFVAGLYVASGRPFFSTTAHPAMIAHRTRSPRWRVVRRPGYVHAGGRTSGAPSMVRRLSVSRVTAGFEFVGPARVDEARRFGLRVAPGQ